MSWTVSRTAVAALTIATLAAPSIAAVSPQPVAGIYHAQILVTAETGCSTGVGSVLEGWLTYPGPAKSGAKFRSDQAYNNYTQVSVASLPATPAAGITSWSGSYSFAALPGGSAVAGTFSATFAFADADSFVETWTDSHPEGGGTCTETEQISLIRSGK